MPFPLAACSAHVLLAAAAVPSEVKVAVPNRGIEVTIEIPDWKPIEKLIDEKRGLLFGQTSHGAAISIQHAENFPFTTGRAWCERLSKDKPGFQHFSVGPVACVAIEAKMGAGHTRKELYAFPTTLDEVFTIHVSDLSPAGEATITRGEFEKIVASFGRLAGPISNP